MNDSGPGRSTPLELAGPLMWKGERRASGMNSSRSNLSPRGKRANAGPSRGRADVGCRRNIGRPFGHSGPCSPAIVTTAKIGGGPSSTLTRDGYRGRRIVASRRAGSPVREESVRCVIRNVSASMQASIAACFLRMNGLAALSPPWRRAMERQGWCLLHANMDALHSCRLHGPFRGIGLR